MNSSLYGNVFQIPKEIKTHILNSFNECGDVNNNTEGYRRNLELQKAKTITYQQLKRIKNWFDSFSGKKEDKPYILNGGDFMRTWVDNILSGARNSTKGRNERLKDYKIDNNYNSIPSFNPEDLVPLSESIKKIKTLIKKIENADFRSN